MTFTETYETKREYWACLLMRRLRITREDAEDLLQGAFLRTFSRPPTDPKQYAPHIWLRALGDGKNLLRARAKRPRYEQVNEKDGCFARDYRGYDDVDNKDAMVTFSRRLRKGEEKLLDPSKTTIELARELGVSPSTVQLRKKAARERIQSLATAV